jgi:hypothetical protein
MAAVEDTRARNPITEAMMLIFLGQKSDLGKGNLCMTLNIYRDYSD